MLRLVRRFIFAGLLLIHLAILALWWDSWHTMRVTIFPDSTQRFGSYSGDGLVVFNLRGNVKNAPKIRLDDVQRLFDDLNSSPALPRGRTYVDPLWLDPVSKRLAVEWVDVPTSPPLSNRYLRICFPYWFAAAVSGAVVWPWIGWIAFRRRRARRRDRAGLCPKCGYDMRANPARCSECGHSPAETVGAP